MLALSAALFTLSLGAQGAEVSKKKEIAVFALSYYGWQIPYEALAEIDSKIQKVFVDMGRFDVIGLTQRFKSGDVDRFIKTIKAAKEENFVLPEEYTTGDKAFTQADFNKLIGSFIVAIPVVTSYESEYKYNKYTEKYYYETKVKTVVTFYNVEDDKIEGIAEIESSAIDFEDQMKSIKGAIAAIPSDLEFKTRSIEAFKIKTQILAVERDAIKIQLGQDMGIQVGDEFIIYKSESYGDVVDQREIGSATVKDVSSKLSTAYVLFADEALVPGMQLKEIPRSADFDLYAAGIFYLSKPSNSASKFGLALGLTSTASRGFFTIRPKANIEAILDGDLYTPLFLNVGAEYNLYMGRLILSVSGFVGASTPLGLLAQDVYVGHVGGKVQAQASYLLNRDMRVFLEGGAAYYADLTDYYGDLSFMGAIVRAGVTFKL
jgi:hypothetical protein